jgi:phospholipid N-methyltransferase
LEKTHPRNKAHAIKRLDFLRGFLKEPKQVGSVIPSSRYMERRIIEFAELDRAATVVELGPGTGGTTRALLDAMPGDSRLLAIDLDPRFTEIVARIGDERLVARTGDAAELQRMLHQTGLGRADVVISGIPFSTLPDGIGTAILEDVRSSLTARGVFVAYQFRSEVARLAEPVFGPPARSASVPWNIPPMRIWQWRRAR